MEADGRELQFAGECAAVERFNVDELVDERVGIELEQVERPEADFAAVCRLVVLAAISVGSLKRRAGCLVPYRIVPTAPVPEQLWESALSS